MILDAFLALKGYIDLVTRLVASSNLARRALSLLVCYVVALQAFLAAYGTAFAISRADVDAGFAICHGAGAPPTPDDNSNTSEKAPCALCAVAAAAGGLLNDPAILIGAPRVVCGSVGIADQTFSLCRPDARAGLSRAPPVLV